MRPVAAEDLLQVRWPMEPAVGPDTGHLAYVVATLDPEADRLAHRLRGLDGRGETLEVAGDEQRQPRWSADGRRLAWMSGSPPDTQVEVLEFATGRRLTTRLGGSVMDFDLSADGRRILAAVKLPAGAPAHSSPRLRGTATRAREEAGDGCQLWEVTLGMERSDRCLWQGRGTVAAPRWSPDGLGFAFLVDQAPTAGAPASTALFTDSIAEPDLRCLVRDHGPIVALAWSPDATTLGYLGQPRRGDPAANRELWIVEPGDDPSPRRLGAHLDRSIGQVVRGDDERGLGAPTLAWTPDGDALVTPFADGGRSGIGRFDLDGGYELVVEGKRAILECVVCADGSLVYSWSDALEPGELSATTVDGAESQLTCLNRDWTEQVALASTIGVGAVTAEGTEIEGWLTLPARQGARLVSLVVEIHGGPHFPVGWRFSMNAQRWAAQGRAVLRLNPRGSQGYGQAFAGSIYGDWGGRDLQDVLALVDAASLLAPLDPARYAIVGESYGGYLASWALARTDRFAVGIAENCLSDLVAAQLAAADPSFWAAELGGHAWGAAALHRDRSPVMFVEDVHAPVLLIHAEQDAVVGRYQVEALWTALSGLGRETDLLYLPDEGHLVNVVGRPSSRLARIEIVDRWFRRHLDRPRGRK